MQSVHFPLPTDQSIFRLPFCLRSPQLHFLPLQKSDCKCTELQKVATRHMYEVINGILCGQSVGLDDGAENDRIIRNGYSRSETEQSGVVLLTHPLQSFGPSENCSQTGIILYKKPNVLRNLRGSNPIVNTSLQLVKLVDQQTQSCIFSERSSSTLSI